MTKDEIRKYIRFQKSLLDEEKRISHSLKIFHFLEQLPSFNLSKNILSYYSLPDEVFTKAFLENWYIEKNIFLPKIIDDEIRIVKYSNTDSLNVGKYNILEPNNDIYYSLENMDLAIIPAVAIDKGGNRIGRGKGYYDRLLTSSKVTKIGIVYNFQIVDNIEWNKYDVPLDYAITENGILKF